MNEATIFFKKFVAKWSVLREQRAFKNQATFMQYFEFMLLPRSVALILNENK